MTQFRYSEIVEGTPIRVQFEGAPVCVARVGQEVFAIGDTCSHADASLSEGEQSGYEIECWLHGAQFDLRTGAAITLPATTPVQKYEVIRDGDFVTIAEGISSLNSEVK